MTPRSAPPPTPPSSRRRRPRRAAPSRARHQPSIRHASRCRPYGDLTRLVDRRHPVWVMSCGAGSAYVDGLVRFLRAASRGLGPDRSGRSRPVRHPGALPRPRRRLVDWDSRGHRKQAGRLDAGRGSTWWAPGAVGWWIGVLFMIGSVCFAVGALPGYVDWVGTDADAITFFVGSIFFTTAAFLQYLETVNADPHARRARAPIGSAFWTWEPRPHRLVGERACSSSAPSSSTSARSPRSTPSLDADAGAPPRVAARRARLDLLPRRQRARLGRGRPPLVVVATAAASRGGSRR